MPKLDDYDIVGLHERCDLVEMTFTGESPSVATPKCFVDNRDAERVRQKDAPTSKS